MPGPSLFWVLRHPMPHQMHSFGLQILHFHLIFDCKMRLSTYWRQRNMSRNQTVILNSDPDYCHICIRALQGRGRMLEASSILLYKKQPHFDSAAMKWDKRITNSTEWVDAKNIWAEALIPVHTPLVLNFHAVGQSQLVVLPAIQKIHLQIQVLIVFCWWMLADVKQTSKQTKNNLSL